MKQKEVYVVWNKEDDRVAIRPNDFGSIPCYLALEQAQASFSLYYDLKCKEKLEIRKLLLVDSTE